MNRREARAVLMTLRGLPPETARQILAGLSPIQVAAVREEWWWQAHGRQHEPDAAANGEPWRVWAIVAGRGFGKTRAGAEWVWARAREHENARIALVAASLDEVERVMVEGESGLLALARRGERPRWMPSKGTLRFPSGAAAFAYPAEKPGKLRGPQHHFAWADELAKWPDGKGQAAWDNLMLGLRLGDRPRTIVTTTPQPVPLLKAILAMPRCAHTGGRTDENRHLPADFIEAVTGMYAGTRLGRQELEGLLLEDVPGALWTREMLETARVAPLQGGELARIVIGLDPPASAGGDACGILVCGIGRDGIGYVLADLSVSGLRPEGWAAKAAEAAALWGAACVVAEKNQGGDMVDAVLRAAETALPVRLVHAGKGKAARAEPIALRFEAGRAKLAGRFPELEDELCALTWAGWTGRGRSPDRADAMVWAMTDLFEKPPVEPRVRGL